MMLRLWCVLICCSAVFVTGCGSNNQPILAPKATASDAENTQPWLDHPEFKNWNRFPVNSYVIRKRSVTNEFGSLNVTTKMWLDSKTNEQVAVGSQITVERPGKPIEVNPSNVVTYPARFQLPTGMSEEDFYLPTKKAKESGHEATKVGEKEVETIIYEWDENNEAGPMRVKLWRSDEVPGRIVKQQMLTVSSNTKIEESIEEMDTTGEHKLEVKD